MTLPYERTNSILSTRRFLIELLDPRSTPRVPREIRLQARALLKHFPNRYDMTNPGESIQPSRSQLDRAQKCASCGHRRDEHFGWALETKNVHECMRPRCRARCTKFREPLP